MDITEDKQEGEKKKKIFLFVTQPTEKGGMNSFLDTHNSGEICYKIQKVYPFGGPDLK
jgi:hypothetical protein